MAENNNQSGQQGNRSSLEGSSGNQGSDQNRMDQKSNSHHDVSNEQLGRLESQPGNMSGVNIENQRTRNGNQDLASRGSEQETTDNL
ncbi:MAG TPA: hypothetical protein VD794_10130 [Flavisolibacter sp.]|nr:hypothetical protein [Flavisolibacter sp.]